MEKKMKKEIHKSATSGTIYALGFIGAAIYFISNAAGFWGGVLGFLKSIVWPVFFVYYAFKQFGI